MNSPQKIKDSIKNHLRNTQKKLKNDASGIRPYREEILDSSLFDENMSIKNFTIENSIGKG